MGKLVIVTGKKGSGKTAWVAKWYAEKPEGRRIARNVKEVQKALAGGHDVAIDISPSSPALAEGAVVLLKNKFAAYEIVEENVA